LHVGENYLISKDVNEDFKWGFAVGVRLRFELPGEKVSISPFFSARYYKEPLESDPEVFNSLFIFKGGLQFNFRMYNSKDNMFRIYNFVEIGKTGISNYFSWDEPAVITLPGANKLREFYPVITFSGMFGYRFTYGWGYFELVMIS